MTEPVSNNDMSFQEMDKAVLKAFFFHPNFLSAFPGVKKQCDVCGSDIPDNFNRCVYCDGKDYGGI